MVALLYIFITCLVLFLLVHLVNDWSDSGKQWMFALLAMALVIVVIGHFTNPTLYRLLILLITIALGLLIGMVFDTRNKILKIVCFTFVLEAFLIFCFPESNWSAGVLVKGIVDQFELKILDCVILTMVYSFAIRNLDGLPAFFISLGAILLANALYSTTKFEGSFMIVLFLILQIENILTLKLANNES